MQISKITSVRNINNINFKAKQHFETNKPHISTGTDKVFDSGLGRDLVQPSLNYSIFEWTLKNNYFQLPPTAQPDEFQKDAARALLAGKDVLVEAPTGTGKTAIAHYATSNNMAQGKTTFYTTPLKALSNQKLNEFRKVYGDENVGILTGDRRENVEAPIIIMTTEVYRNMALANKYGDKNPLMKNLGTVISDEFHFLGDPDRGSVWEESVMYTPNDVQILGLSATIGNPQELTNWMGGLENKQVHLVSIPESARHVPLEFDMLETSAYKAEEKKIQKSLRKGNLMFDVPITDSISKPVPSDFKMAIASLKNKEQLPAIFFVFSRNYSRELVEYLGKEGQSLTTEAERKEIENIVDSYKARGYIGSDLNEEALLKGYTIHNAGIIPAQKELIEELFQKKLVKVVISTETLAAGINMPAKTVVISSPYKPCDEASSDFQDEDQNIRMLTANEFKQMSGRAGRRGIDEKGFVYTMPTDRSTEQDFLNLEVSASNPIKSKYNPDYGFLSGYYEYHTDSEELEELFAKSFYTYSENEDISAEREEKLLEQADLKSQVLMERGFLTVDEEGMVHPTILAKMAAKVRGYDAITLVETIADKEFAHITPEALAAVAGSIANPPNPMQEEIKPKDDLFGLFRVDYKSIDNSFNRLYSSVQSSLKKLGKSLESFSSYEEVLKFAKSIERPDADEYEVARKLKTLRGIQAKGEVITKKVPKLSEEYSLENLITAFKTGAPVPNDVLDMYLGEIEKYMARVKTDDIPTYISILQDERALLDNATAKGNKERDRIQKHKAGLEIKIKQAQSWQYVYENIFDVMSSNKQFEKEHSLKQAAKELKEVEALYAQLTAKDKLVQGIIGLMSLEEYENNHNLAFDSEENTTKIQDALDALINKGIEVCSTEIKCDVESKVQKYGKSAAQTLYNWALMNKMNTDSMTNWLELLSRTDERDADEGTVYRRVMQTADLLSQIGEIATVGYKESKTEEDKAYYAELKQTASQARDLLIREPATV
ncbi:MAG: DEAD/DEAH box helicase [Candidatus Gastranaerophilales bacterium]|nr:DEAD/DEAH box helicase [Candidatus Gastranaerophilales bacterium]